MSVKKLHIGASLILTLVTASVFAFYLFYQPVITYERCKLCDGNQYLSMYQYLEGSTTNYIASFPYYSRIVVPALASLFPFQNALQDFQLVNFLFSIFSVLSIYFLWKKLQIPVYLILLGLFWLLFHWTGLIRLNAFDPVAVDVPLYLIQALLVLIFLKGSYNWLLPLAPLAVLQKESILVLLLVFLVFAVWNNFYYKENKIPLIPIAAAFILAILIKYLFTLFFPPVQEGYSSVRLVLFYLKEMLYNPFRIFRCISGVYLAYGFFLLLAIFRLSYVKFHDRTFAFLTLMSAVSILLSVIGGQDHTRIAFLGFPFIMTWILILLKGIDKTWLLLALLFSIPLMRIFEKIPDPAQDFSNFALWYPEYAPTQFVTGLFGYFALISLLFIALHLTVKEKQ